MGGRGGCDRRGPLVPSALGLSWKSWTSMCPWGCVCVCVYDADVGVRGQGEMAPECAKLMLGV